MTCAFVDGDEGVPQQNPLLAFYKFRLHFALHRRKVRRLAPCASKKFSSSVMKRNDSIARNFALSAAHRGLHALACAMPQREALRANPT